MFASFAAERKECDIGRFAYGRFARPEYLGNFSDEIVGRDNEFVVVGIEVLADLASVLMFAESGVESDAKGFYLAFNLPGHECCDNAAIKTSAEESAERDV